MTGRIRIAVGEAVCSLGGRFRVAAEISEDLADWLVDLSLRIDPDATSLERLQAQAREYHLDKEIGWGGP